jgi:hypothetical protein
VPDLIGYDASGNLPTTSLAQISFGTFPDSPTGNAFHVFNVEIGGTAFGRLEPSRQQANGGIAVPALWVGPAAPSGARAVRISTKAATLGSLSTLRLSATDADAAQSWESLTAPGFDAMPVSSMHEQQPGASSRRPAQTQSLKWIAAPTASPAGWSRLDEAAMFLGQEYREASYTRQSADDLPAWAVDAALQELMSDGAQPRLTDWDDGVLLALVLFGSVGQQEENGSRARHLTSRQ